MEKNSTKLLNKLKVALYSDDNFVEDPAALDELLLSFWHEEIIENAPITSEEFEKALEEYHALEEKLEATLNEEQKTLYNAVSDGALFARVTEGNAIFLNAIKMGMRLDAASFRD